jgi:hypothetical protein
LAHHAVILVPEDVAGVHEGHVRRRGVGEAHENLGAWTSLRMRSGLEIMHEGVAFLIPPCTGLTSQRAARGASSSLEKVGQLASHKNSG